MQTAPKSMRLQIAIFGRTNAGKSSVLNMLAGQNVAITSPVPGTTTDTVEKSMEFLPIGPVVFLDTAGLDDTGELGALRTERARKIFDRADVALLVAEPCAWGRCEEDIAAAASKKNIPLIVVINKTDIAAPSPELSAALKEKGLEPILCAATLKDRRETTIAQIKSRLLEIAALAGGTPRSILGDLVKPGQTAVLIIPIDKEAPKGRIILPQVQAMRDLLDHGALFLTAREHEYPQALAALAGPPALVVCDSQVVGLMVGHTPAGVPCTTFSILFARFKGDLAAYAAGAGAIKTLRPGDRVAVLEACSHHAIEDDIGRVKLPRWLKESAGGELKIDTFSGRDLPDDISGYKLAIQCGGCMLTRTEILNRMGKAARAGVPITNYGLAISQCKGVLERVLSPFPDALAAYRAA
ncbi:MAG: [FeFe] hydrogenase H-cluster maturation GTPase HydF [Elusimicrobia bacterium RIFOXYA2_FULL_58_8]|nr:MAG: [FeFe] hydrogenase H-cluster maturation GTPase HydF [Elusimicrobia bacterium RIFOXYA2_FULL_58_8]